MPNHGTHPAAATLPVVYSESFAAAGAWMALSGPGHARWAGVFGALFFGACAAAA